MLSASARALLRLRPATSHFHFELGMLMLLHVQNLKHNFAIVDALTEIAARKGITLAQLSIVWVSARGPHVVPWFFVRP